MLEMIIVEDEAMFRSYTRSVLETKTLDIRVCGEAKNGVEALELLGQQHVDIALVDITMPIMGGIALAEAMRRDYPDVEIIFLTGHDEFEYARKAIKLSVQDYLLKPFDEQELEAAVRKAVDKIKHKQEQQALNQQYEAAAEKLFADSLLSDSHEKTEMEVQQFLARVSAGRSIEAYRLVLIEEDHYAAGWHTTGRRDLWKTAITNVLAEIMNPKIHHLPFNGSGHEVAVILLFEAEAFAKQYDYADFYMLCNIAQEKLKISITCAVGECFTSASDIRGQYTLVSDILTKKFVVGCGKVIDTKTAHLSNDFKQYPVVDHGLVTNLLFGDDMEAMKQYIEGLFAECRENRLSMDMVCMLYLQLINLCLDSVAKRGIEVDALYGEDFFPYTDLKSLGSIDEACARAINIFATAGEAFVQRSTRSLQIARQACEYIDANFGDRELSVEQLAGKLYINVGYLRMVFKKEMGVTVSSYIFNTRMEQARRMIASENIRLTDIADSVGFNDISYFSKCFKKKFGTAPSEYALAVRGK